LAPSSSLKSFSTTPQKKKHHATGKDKLKNAEESGKGKESKALGVKGGRN